MTRSHSEGYDWLLGAAGKRIVLTGLFAHWEDGWRATQLARLAGVEPKRTAQGHLARLQALGLAELREGRWYARRDGDIAGELAALLRAIDPELTARAVPPPP